ncbi:MAG: thiamine pyrophosphate-dependent dehydrogenase E1 component subunit alpha [Parcubacteria group bacterium]|nr:thiamine pyrophosphate-dependent dehydrogenase E1 component subunit alpha [Parcubacteria group bacterium]
MADYIHIYKTVITGRVLDAAIRSLYDRGESLVRKFLYSGKGQEAAAAIAALLNKEDYLFPHSYRGFTHLIAKGIPLEKIVGEFFGKKTGMLRGFGDVGGFGYYPELGVMGYSTILGGNFAIACGLAKSIRKSGKKNIVAIFFGDGEASRSTFSGALNIASLWGLPIVFICENNGLAISTPIEMTSATPNIVDRGRGYNIESHFFDGEKIFHFFRETEKIIDNVRREQKPVLIEILTPRLGGHFYMEEKWRYDFTPPVSNRLDPLILFEKELLENKIMEKRQINNIYDQILKEVNDAIEKSLKTSVSSQEEFLSFYKEKL